MIFRIHRLPHCSSSLMKDVRAYNLGARGCRPCRATKSTLYSPAQNLQGSLRLIRTRTLPCPFPANPDPSCS